MPSSPAVPAMPDPPSPVTSDASDASDASDILRVPADARSPDAPAEPSSTNTSPTPGFDPSPNTRRCFVCLVDEPEASLPVDWSTPCKCSLEGHQECLLAWVTDLEAQAKDVVCPVCKSPILVTERYDAAIHLSNFLNHKFSRWSPRILLGFIASSALVSSSVYGAKAISWFAGPDAVVTFLLAKDQARPFLELIRRPRHDQQVNLLHFSVLPLIAPALILNRMNISDLVTLPASLVYATLFNHSAEFLTWPPSPNRIMAIYPALKSIYFHIHRAVSDSLERSWALRARTMSVEHGLQPTHDVAPPPEPAPAMNILDLEIDIQIGEADDDMLRNDGGAPRNRGNDGGGRSPINFIAGALLWPGVCYGVGEIMRHLLPSRFVSRPTNGPVTGLLQERWGRSFIGGCLFVVLKDAFFLYVKYKRMMNRPYRRIKNSERRNVRN
ncbi:hypothetical protein EKO27_g10383 [Xylaria grammica]|uniref:RING-CH-type domain-containing protein n=1 Tax=Xylaria grammica TaxID=363999 RepID=A0A439CRB3_9PEZI|nr:hypothetical protein EKO27_g10383 [Xylaria grammica]